MRRVAERGGPPGPGGEHLAVGREVSRGGQDQGDDRPDRQGQDLPQVHVQGKGCQAGQRSGRHVLGHEEGGRVRRQGSSALQG